MTNQSAVAREIADYTFVATETARQVLVERIEAALASAREEGAREMQRSALRAARVAEATHPKPLTKGEVELGRRIRVAIRALPLSTQPEEG